VGLLGVEAPVQSGVEKLLPPEESHVSRVLEEVGDVVMQRLGEIPRFEETTPVQSDELYVTKP